MERFLLITFSRVGQRLDHDLDPAVEIGIDGVGRRFERLMLSCGVASISVSTSLALPIAANFSRSMTVR